MRGEGGRGSIWNGGRGWGRGRWVTSEGGDRKWIQGGVGERERQRRGLEEATWWSRVVGWRREGEVEVGGGNSTPTPGL